MLVGILSDTHDRVKASDRAVALFNRLDVRVVAHAGDWCAPFSLLKFRDLKAEMKRTLGNPDGECKGLLGFDLDDFVEFSAAGVNVPSYTRLMRGL